MEPDPLLAARQKQFNAAMARFASGGLYPGFGRAVSAANIGLQALLLLLALSRPAGPWGHAAAVIAAFVLADFINGFVHLVMDNRDDYTSAAGPLIAAFHLHHRTPAYTVRPPVLVYFNETGSKVWLVPFLGTGALLAWHSLVPSAAVWAWFYFGVFSSLAELSHYCCHVPDTPLPRLLSKAGLFMSKKRHARHHVEDNTHYAFLNGMTDPVLDLVARRFFNGYKQTTDRHFALYTGQDTENRG